MQVVMQGKKGGPEGRLNHAKLIRAGFQISSIVARTALSIPSAASEIRSASI
jgi:hypothetical protein